MTAGDTALGLLLADSFDLAPALAHGLPAAAAETAPRPDTSPGNEMLLDAPDGDPNDLALQRWGVIAPPGAAGDAALAALAPLLELRAREQGAAVTIYRDAPVAASEPEAVRWRTEVWEPDEDSRPRYLMLIGDADVLSFELQHVLACSAFVGRIAAATSDDYAAYAAKVVRWAASPGTRPGAIFFGADDGSEATAVGRALLVEPCLQLARTVPRFPAGEIAQLAPAATAVDFVRALDRPTPAVLVSVSHGLGAPRRGWSSQAEQRALQGALLVSRDGPPPRDRLVTAELLRGRKVLPGGVWFCLACFGAGTPRTSSFQAWLAQLEAAGAVSGLIDRLPAGGAPFVAAMPQAALASPDGPLAMIGHVDLAWTYAFADREQPCQSRAPRIFSSVQVLVRGSRAGVALDALMRSYRAVNDELLGMYDAQERARLWQRASGIEPARLARAFMARTDLRGYVLLGDPAVRLAPPIAPAV